jgi:hypothetical protein
MLKLIKEINVLYQYYQTDSKVQHNSYCSVQFIQFSLISTYQKSVFPIEKQASF